MTISVRSKVAMGVRLARVAGCGAMLSLALGVEARAAAAPSKVPLSQLKADADKVWQLNERGDFAEAGNRGAAIALAADALAENGKLEEAKEYYRRAGLVRPWDLDARMHRAEVLQKLGDDAGATALTKTVARFAETDQLLGRARAILRESEPLALPQLAEIQAGPGEAVIGLVAAPGTERWLLNALGRRLEATLGLRVGVAAADFEVGKCDRTGRAQVARELRATLPWKDPSVGVVGPDGNRVDPEKMSDEQVIEVMKALLRRETTMQQLESFGARLVAANKIQFWWDSRMLGILRERFPQVDGAKVVYVALLPVDLCTGAGDVVYGSASADGSYAVVSYYRFAASFTTEPPKSARLLDRTSKQLLSSVGFALGVSRCTETGCARTYPRSLAEQDAKDPELCDECRAKFAKTLGRELPPAPERKD